MEQPPGTLPLDGISPGASSGVLRGEEDPLRYREPSGPRRGPTGSVQRRSRSCARSRTVRPYAADRLRLRR
jgi:hypothetical protein